MLSFVSPSDLFKKSGFFSIGRFVKNFKVSFKIVADFYIVENVRV